jgi:superfamily II DNA or RNA helicase/HKD family nuclease
VGNLVSGQEPAAGLYEQLVTQAIEEQVEDLRGAGWHVVEAPVGTESSPHVLARYLGQRAAQALAALPEDQRVSVANEVLRALEERGDGGPAGRIADGPRQLLAIAEKEAPGVYTVRPATPLSESTLLTNAPEDPSLGTELRAELATANRVDLICAFVKWYGLRVLEEPLRAAAARKVPIRVVTTTYMGATDRYALDRLVREFGAEVKVNYELRSTRLHAKAWLFRRRSGFDTAYVGSSNLSRAALLDGVEWNVRLSSVSTPAVLKKFEATFESYWSDPSFELYNPDQDAARLDEALNSASGRGRGDSGQETTRISLSGLEVRPYPHQRDMLDQLNAEREVHGLHRNLLVAATGTGKTVMAALDYRAMLRRLGRKPEQLSLLFVAHRQEILKQSLRTYQDVLTDANFGELLVGGNVPENWRHVFASVQSLGRNRLEELAPDHFDVIVIDEFHHSTAPTYRRIIDHFQPMELLGLTATPERSDGRHVHVEYFDGRIAAEMRLWEALENDLLSPFHYFGIADNTDLSTVGWRRGAYDPDELDRLFTGNEARARLVVKALQDKVAEPQRMRALGFCVSVSHAYFMAEYFRRAGIVAAAVDGSTPQSERDAALELLRLGELQVLFSVDLFNEGLDIPDVDTLLLLRPTQSATVFLQQLGRGLRRTEDKPVLTVIDFVGQHRAEFRIEEQFRALTNLTRRRLVEHVEQDFPQLPSGCQIILDRKSKQAVLDNIKAQLKLGIKGLANEVREYARPELAEYLRESRREPADLYRGSSSWTALLRRAGLLDGEPPAGEDALLKRVSTFLHAADPLRVAAYTELLSDDAIDYAELTEQQRGFAHMLFFSLWPTGGGFADYQAGFDSLREQSAFRSEVRQLLAWNLDHTRRPTSPLLGAHSGVPLALHAEYSREEILPALRAAELGGFVPGNFREGVKWCPAINTDALMVTLTKDEKDFSPTTRYHDYALSPTLFHWESQNSTSPTSGVGMRYRQHQDQGSHVLLFVRRFKNTDSGGPQPWTLLGPVDYKSHEGSKPMAVVWQVRTPIPADIELYSAIAGVG